MAKRVRYLTPLSLKCSPIKKGACGFNTPFEKHDDELLYATCYKRLLTVSQ